jgi:GT2 family glycosyltransferase
MSKCYLSFDAEFKWTNDDTPFVPIMSGGLLAMSRRWWQETGGYDTAMLGWGGENLDQSLRIWLCGGEIYSASDSYVAHMWRDGSKPKTNAR